LEYAEDVSADDRAGGVNAMDRSELIQRLVLREISDDYESVDQIILRDVARDGAKLGLSVERSDIVDALARLIEDGLAKAYLLSSREPYSTELPSMPGSGCRRGGFQDLLLYHEEGNRFPPLR
jgi:hypothetical protein